MDVDTLQKSSFVCKVCTAEPSKFLQVRHAHEIPKARMQEWFESVLGQMSE